VIIDMDAAIKRGPFVHFMIGNLPANFYLTSILWCFVLAASSLGFSDWSSVAVTGSVNLLPYFIVGLLMIWPWTSVVVSGAMFTIKVEENDGWYIMIL
jgi:hypothetical protein